MTDNFSVSHVEDFFGVKENKILGFFFKRHMDENGNISFKYFSDAIYEILNIPLDFETKGFFNMIHFADKEKYIRDLKQSTLDLNDYIEEFRVISTVGKVKWFRGSVRVIKNDDNSFDWEGVLIDITMDKLTEEWFETTLNNAPEGILTFDEKGVVLSSNSTMRNLFGYGQEELLGSVVYSLIKPEHAEYFSSYIKNFLLVRMDNPRQNVREYEGVRKDGSTFPVEFSLNDIKKEGVLLFILIIRDITQRKKTETALRESEIRLGNIVSAMPCAFFTSSIRDDGGQESLYISEGSKSVFRLDNSMFVPKNNLLLEQFEDEDANDIVEFRKSLFRNNKIDMFEREVKLKNGNWVHLRIRPERLKNGSILNHGLAIDITERKKAEEQIRYLAYHDLMTGAGNRAYLMKAFPKFISSANRHNKKFAVISIIPTNMSYFYANSGYDIGDMLMEEVANRITKVISDRDCLTYASGSRFILLKGGISHGSEIDDFCKNLEDIFIDSMKIEGQEFDVNVKIGVSIYPTHSSDSKALLKYSEVALSSTKYDFQSEYQIFSEHMKSKIARNLSLRTRLKHAILNKQILPYFQAQVDVLTGEIIGMEVLARWNDEEEGFIPPDVFIKIAEEYGLIESLSEAIIEEACKINKRWIDQGIARVPIAVNISGKHDPKSVLRLIDKMLNDIGLPPECLEVELTESAMMEDALASRRTIEKLRKRGVLCSVDDFGTGYSSLSMLKRFPLKKLKIDRTFVLDINSANGKAIINATIAMAKALNLVVLAEGVDNTLHFKYLKEQGCDIIQGYLFSKPLCEKDMEEKLKNWDSCHEISLVNMN